MIVLASELRGWLVDAGIVRLPTAAADEDNLPVCFTDLAAGPVPPEDLIGIPSCDTTVHLSEIAGPAGNPFEYFLDATNIEVMIISKDTAYLQGLETGKKIVAALKDKQRFQMGDLDISSCYLYAGLGRLPLQFEGAGYAWRTEFGFTLRIARELV